MSLPFLPVGKALVAVLESGTGKRCGYGRLPTTSGTPVVPPYMVLTPITRTEDGAPLGNGSDWTVQEWQVTNVGGAHMDEAVWMQDKSHGVLVDQTAAGAYVHPFTVVGMKVLRRELAEAVGPDESGGIVSLVSRYAITLTGA